MASVNKCIIVGNLGADPEVRTFQNGGKIANVSIATTDRWTDKQTGEQKEHTEWHRVSFSDRLADIVAQYLRKGSQVYVEGSIKTRKYQDQNGQDRYTTEIRATSMQMLGSRQDGQQPQQYTQQSQNGYRQGYGQVPQGQGYQGATASPTIPAGLSTAPKWRLCTTTATAGASTKTASTTQGYQSQQANGYNKGFAHPSEVGYQNDGYGNLVPITPQVLDEDMPF